MGSSSVQMRAPLVRPRRCVLGGVCAALSAHLGMSVVVVRVIMVVAALAGGAGILFYLWLWAMVPVEPRDSEAAARVERRINVPWMLFAASVVAAAVALFGARGLSEPALVSATLIAVACAAGGVAWDQLVETTGGVDTVSWAQVPNFAGSVAQAVAGAKERGQSRRIRIASGCLLVVMALFEPVAWSHGESWIAWPLFTLTVLTAAVVLFGPWALRLWRELIGERTVRVREEQRAEIAAHLHDSVLQTLALIQNRSGAGSEVARIARAQERELRDWLYAGAAPLDTDIVTELRDFAAALELDHAVRIEVVAVGEARERGDGEVAAAAREAMLNAARHAGGDVSVYVENSPGAVDVFVRDRGGGFDVDEVPQGRLGVRESILGRMRRAGGTAEVARGVGGVGTEVRLHLDSGSARRGAERDAPQHE